MDIKELLNNPDLAARSLSKIKSDPELYRQFVAAAESGDKEAVNQQVLGAASSILNEAVNYRANQAASQMDFAKDALATGAIGLASGLGGAALGSRLGTGRVGTAALETGLDTAGNLLYDVGVRDLPAQQAMINAALNAGVGAGGSLGLDVVAKAIDPGERAGLGYLANKAQRRGAVFNQMTPPGGAKGNLAVTTDLINPKITPAGEVIPSVENQMVRSGFFDQARNAYDPNTLQFAPGGRALGGGVVDAKRDAAVFAIESIKQAKPQYVDALDSAYSLVKSQAPEAIKGVKLKELLDNELLQWMRDQGSWAVSQGKAESAFRSLKEFAGDVAAKRGVANADSAVSAFDSYLRGEKPSSTMLGGEEALQKKGALADSILEAELSPAEVNSFIGKLQDELALEGAYDAQLRAALMSGNPSKAISGGESSPFDIALAKRLVPKLQDRLSILEKNIRFSPAGQTEEFLMSFGNRQPDWLTQANRAQHALLKTREEVLGPLQAAQGGSQYGGQISNIPVNAQQVIGEAGRGVLGTWAAPAVRAGDKAEKVFADSALMAAAQLNPEAFGPNRNAMMRALAMSGTNILGYMSGFTGPTALDRSTATLEADPSGTAGKLFKHLLTSGKYDEPTAFMIASDAQRVLSQPGMTSSKKQFMGNLLTQVPEAFVPTNEGYHGVLDGRFINPMEQSDHLRETAFGQFSLDKEANIMEAGLSGRYRSRVDDVVVPTQAAIDITPMQSQDPLASLETSLSFEQPQFSTEYAYPQGEDLVEKMKKLSNGTDVEAY